MLTILRGHTSPETAYVVEDYPYGFRLRCRIRYWLDTATKGSHRGETRLMHSTTDPKRGDDWTNKPKGSTYDLFVVLYRDESTGHVRHWSVGRYAGPEEFARFVASGLYDGLNDAERAEFDKLADWSRKTNPVSYGEWDRITARVREALKTAPTEFPADALYAKLEKEEGFSYRPRLDAALAYVRAVDEKRYAVPTAA